MGAAYKLKPFYGNLPIHSKGMNIGRLDRKAICERYNFTPKQISKAYWNWQEVFRLDGSDLTFEQYLDKLIEVNITPSNVGNDLADYNLSRYNDTGCYTINNCRFITKEENLDEQVH